MVKFIGHWMFASHIWHDEKPSPVVINMREIAYIDEHIDHVHGKHVVVSLNCEDDIPIEGDIIEVLSAFQKHLSTMY